MDPNKYDNAKFYDCRDAEHLSHESPAEAIEAEVDANGEPGCDVAAVISNMGDITVTAYEPEAVTSIWIHHQCDRMVEQLAENFSEDFGDIDGNGDYLSAADRAALATALEPVVREALSKARVWRCRIVGERTYSVEEVLAMMRKHNPDWFDAGLVKP